MPDGKPEESTPVVMRLMVRVTAGVSRGSCRRRPVCDLVAAPTVTVMTFPMTGRSNKAKAAAAAVTFLLAVPGIWAAASSGMLSGDVQLVVATPRDGTLDISVVTVPAGNVDAAITAFEAEGASAGVNGRVFSLGDPRIDEQWGYLRLGGPVLLDAGATGSGVIVAVLDTGVDGTHPELAGRVLPGYDIVTRKPMPDAIDPGGHGTHVAGIIAASATNGQGGAGIAPGVRILPVRVLDDTGYGDDAGVAEGLVWAVDHGAAIVNMSLGTYDDNPAMRAAVVYAHSRGVAVVASAGNDRAGGPTTYPAAYPDAFAVAAVSSADERAYFSTTGAYVDVAAPGQMIMSTYPGGGYVMMSGTSMAAPFVSGSIAVVIERTGLSPLDAAEAIRSTATDLGPVGRDDEYGAGLVSVTEASRVAGKQPPVAGPPTIMPGLPSLAPLPFPTIATPSLPALPGVPAGSFPGLPQLPRLAPGASPSLPALPGSTLKPVPSTPTQAPLPSPTIVAPTPVVAAPVSPTPFAKPADPPIAAVPSRPVVQPSRTAVALSVVRSRSGWTARVQVAGPARARARVVITKPDGTVVATGQANTSGLLVISVKAPAGTVLTASAGGGMSNPAKVGP